MHIQGKAILITGASSGIGRAVAIACAKRGARGIALLARREEALEAVAKNVEQFGCKALVLTTDVSSDESVEQAILAAKHGLGSIDIVIANAGVAPRHLANQPDFNLVKKVFEVNVLGVARVLHGVLPDMIEAGQGHLVTISSIAGYRGLPGSGLYSSSKAAVSTLMEGYRGELEQTGITVTNVCPGFVRTDMALNSGSTSMPWMIEAEEAARKIVEGIEADKKDIVFPWQMKVVMGAVRLLPRALFDRVGTRVFLGRKQTPQP